jgi:hypothetical protein
MKALSSCVVVGVLLLAGGCGGRELKFQPGEKVYKLDEPSLEVELKSVRVKKNRIEAEVVGGHGDALLAELKQDVGMMQDRERAAHRRGRRDEQHAHRKAPPRAELSQVVERVAQHGKRLVHQRRRLAHVQRHLACRVAQHVEPVAVDERQALVHPARAEAVAAYKAVALVQRQKAQIREVRERRVAAQRVGPARAAVAQRAPAVGEVEVDVVGHKEAQDHGVGRERQELVLEQVQRVDRSHAPHPGVDRADR